MEENTKQNKFGLKIAIPIAAVVLVVVIAVSILIQKPISGEIYSSKANSAVYEALSKVGITESNTIEEGNTIMVTYQLPEEAGREAAEFFVMGALSTIASSMEKVIIASYSGENKIGEIEVQVKDLLNFKDNKITSDELISRIKRNL